MFQIGQLILYGNTGVCRVEAIGPPQLAAADKTKDYYTLAPPLWRRCDLCAG